MAKNYQRKQTALIFVACFVLVSVTALYVYGFPATKDYVEFQNIAIKSTASNENESIATSTDWQKQFFDSNKTGSFKAATTSSNTSLKEAPLNPTELLGRNFFTKYAELRQAGLTTDSQAVNAVTSKLINDSVAGVPTPKAYTAKNIIIVPVGNDLNATKNYASNLVNILKNWMPAKTEAEIAMDAFEKGDMTMLKQIDPIIIGYKNALAKLLVTPVVQPLAQYHLDLVNGISIQIFNAQSLRNADTDPVTGLAAVSLEMKSLQTISNSIAGMQNYFSKAGIVFSLPVSGSILQSQ